ncbi:MAG: glycosyltransferase family 4 protein [Actinomycetota bacterium]|nr:glycosyltransferase family 4 protein [Actinomycetota bacterium]
MLETPPRYPPFTGGVENVAQAVSRRLVARGDEVLVVCADEPRGAPPAGDGVPVRRLPWRVKYANTNVTLGLPWTLVREPWDVVHTHLPTPWSADWSVLVARLLGRGSVVSFYNAIVGEGLAGRVACLYNATVLRATLGLADRVIVVSDAWRDRLVASQPGIAGKIVVIPTGVDLAAHVPGGHGDGRQILFVGILDRFHRYKGLDVLLDALATVREPFELTVVGDGELRAEYERQSRRLGLSSTVRFVGRIGDEELRRTYGRSDVYVLPSDFAPQEGGFTLTALEAMASGVPVVLADGAGQVAVDAAADGAGIRVGAGDVGGLAAAISRLLSDAEERARMGASARAFVERRHSWDEIAEARRAVYAAAADEALARRRGDRGRC